MLIQKKRIRNIDNYIPNFDGRDIYIAHSLPDAGKTDSIGFSSQRALGEEVLPKILGPITRFNANGKSVPDKTAPKETAYRQISWTRKQWIGGAQLKKLLTLVKLSISATRESSPSTKHRVKDCRESSRGEVDHLSKAKFDS